MRPLPDPELQRVKEHIVADLLPLHHRRVTHALPGLLAAAILQRFSHVAHRFALWLRGDTGDGKTLLAKLYMGFFGDYKPTDDRRFVNWGWTPLSIEKVGYLFRDALFLMDDFKTGLANRNQVVRLLQSYADGGGRGRLHADATLNAPRWIRGQLLVTGEQAIDDEASSLARTIIVPVEKVEHKDAARRTRCFQECVHYSGVMLDFIAWVQRHGHHRNFADRVRQHEARLYALVEGQPNDSRVAANFAVLVAASELIMEYFGDVLPNWNEEVRRFIDEDVPALLKPMINEVRQQRPVHIYYETLAALIHCKRVKLDDDDIVFGNAPIIGKCVDLMSGIYFISSEMSLAEVQKSLRDQGRPPLPLRSNQLGPLLIKEGKAISEAELGFLAGMAQRFNAQVRIQGQRRRGFCIQRFSMEKDLEDTDAADEDATIPAPAADVTPAGMTAVNGSAVAASHHDDDAEPASDEGPGVNGPGVTGVTVEKRVSDGPVTAGDDP